MLRSRPPYSVMLLGEHRISLKYDARTIAGAAESGRIEAVWARRVFGRRTLAIVVQDARGNSVYREDLDAQQ